MSAERRPSGGPPYWPPGTRITWREGSGPLGTGDPVTDLAQPHFATPVTVVRDDADALVVRLTTGTPVQRIARADGRDKRADPGTLFTTPFVAEAGVHEHYDQLRIVPTGRPWSVWVMVEAATGDFAGWYVNLERPHLRDADAVFTSDHVLDLWVAPDRTVVRKDEDELPLAVAQRVLDELDAERILADRVAVERLVEEWGSPFCDGWERLTP